MSVSAVLRTAFLACAAAFSTFAQAITADEADSLLSSIHQMRVESYLAINAYYNFSISNGDKSLAAEASSTINRIDNHLNTIRKAPGAADIQADLTAVADKWKRYRDLLNTNLKDLMKLGYPDLRLAVEMAQANVEFVNTLGLAGENVKKTADYRPNEMIELVRGATIKMEQMMTAYAARSSSNVSQVAQGAETEEPLDVLADQFSSQLDSMLKSAHNDAATRKVVDGIITKWNFIKGSYVNYNENNVNYVANLYSKRIIESLQQLEGSYAKL